MQLTLDIDGYGMIRYHSLQCHLSPKLTHV